ncbi:MAG: peptide chain release factor N(5)-glutamine methyltransferase, partial [Bradyrhizobium sp.]|nr:peptide chain release factor N(5)-glutamine methyltransferase [Bradyrhizobium sp.]
IASSARRLTRQEAELLFTLAQRRIAGEPVARILCEKEFWGLRLELSPETLVPRPDTETVVEMALDMVGGKRAPGRALRILDIGTGSGAILLALLSEYGEAFGIGTDISEGALRTARRNAAALGYLPRAAFVACDYAAPLQGQFELIVSNPPYIRSADIAGLAKEVREHDPYRALDGGSDGLSSYRLVIPEAARLLADGGAVVLELGSGQSGQVERLMRAAGLVVTVPPVADLSGVPRAAGARKMPR